MEFDALKPTMIVWWRYGKEHPLEEGDELRCNPPEMVAAHIDEKLALFRATPDTAWRWWQVDDDLLIERGDPETPHSGLDTCIYYLPALGLTIIENIHLPPPYDEWKWYIHLCDIFYDEARKSWIEKDLFCDILVAADNQTHRVLDLADLGDGLDLGLVSPDEASEILRKTHSALARIAAGEFPFAEVQRGQRARTHLGWADADSPAVAP